MRIKLYILFVVLLLVPVVKGQVVKFEKIFGGKGYDFGYDVIQTFDKGYAVVGSTSSFGAGSTDGYLLKTDSLGNFQWQQTFGYINVDHFYSIQETADSGLLMAGYTNNFGAGGYDVYVVKTDKNGNYLWAKTYGGTNWDFGYSISTTNDGGFVLTGGTYSYGSGDEDVFLVRANSNGDTLWTKAYGGLGQDEGKSVSQTTDGGFILTGYTKSFGDVSGDTYTIKTDGNGDTLWTYIYHGSLPDFSTCVLEQTNGNFVIAGKTKSFGNGGDDGFKILISPSGGFISSAYYGGTSDDDFYSIAESPGGRFAMLGSTKSYGNGNEDFVLYIENPYNGFHSSTFGGVNTDIGMSMKKTQDGGYIICGKSASYSILDHIYLIKTDSNGVASGTVNLVDTGIPENGQLSAFNINVFPNPADNIVVLNLPETLEDNTIVSIVDITGRKLFTYELKHLSTFMFETDSFADGVYFICIQNKDFSCVEKLIVKH